MDGSVNSFCKHCRLCLSSKGPMLPIIYEDLRNINYRFTVFGSTAEKIFFVTSIAVSQQDHLPNNVCKKCDDYMNDFVNFKQQCITHSNQLQHYWTLSLTNPRSAIMFMHQILNDPTKSSYEEINFENHQLKKETRELVRVTEPTQENIFSPCNSGRSTDTAQNQTGPLGKMQSMLSRSEHIALMPLINYMEINEDDHNSAEDYKYRIDEKCEVSLEDSEDPLQIIPGELDLTESHRVEKANPVVTQRVERSSKTKKKRVKTSEYAKRKVCTVCNEKFTKMSLLYDHQKSTLHNRIKCRHCPENFKDKQSLNAHKDRYHIDCICQECGKTFRGIKRLKNHQEKVCRSKSFFLCNVCAQSFDSKKSWAVHLQIHEHADLRGIPMTMFCRNCEFSTTSVHSLLLHLGNAHSIFVYERNLECDYCGYKHSSKSALLTHIQKCHLKEKFKCEQCNTEWKTAIARRQHIFRTHKRGREKTHKCPICQKMLQRDVALKNHMRTHTGETPFKCSYCDRAFTLKQNLDAHLRLHTGDKPYKCEICGLGFRHNVSKKNHQKYHKDVPGFVYTPPVNNRKKKEKKTVDVLDDAAPQL